MYGIQYTINGIGCMIHDIQYMTLLGMSYDIQLMTYDMTYDIQYITYDIYIYVIQCHGA